jgi:RNA polymerase sigma factor (sigma-70 family)
MSGTTLMIETFDRFFAHNYQRLYTHALCYEKTEDRAIDLLHDTYLKIKTRIILSGFTTYRFITYCCTAITNTFYAQRKAKKNRLNYIEVEDCFQDIENQNLNTAEDWLENEEHHQQTEKLTKQIFEFLGNRYNEKEIFIFTVYYLMSNERMTYQKISNQTGVNITTCSLVIKKIKKDLRENLFKYINDQRRNTGVTTTPSRIL